MTSPSTSADRIAHSGVWPALLTPLRADLSIDEPLFARHARELLEAGCTGVTPFGTTGEGPSFSVAERRRALEAMIAAGVPANRILVSTSCAALPDVVELTRHAQELGTHACLLMPPFFLKGVPDEGVLDAYCQVIDAVADSNLRLVLYHIPQVSGVALSHSVVEQLRARYPGVVIGIKDSGCQREVSINFAKAFMPAMQVWVGNEPDLQELTSLGSCGAVSGVANILPRLLQRLVSQQSQQAAVRDQQRVLALLAILGGYGLTAAFKGMMAILNDEPGWRRVRAPLRALTDAQFGRIRQQLSEFSLNRQLD